MSIHPSMVVEFRSRKSIRRRPNLFSKATNFCCNSKQKPGGNMDILITQDIRKRTVKGNLRRCQIIHSLGLPTNPIAQPKASSRVIQNTATFRRLRKQRLVRARTQCFRMAATSCLRSCHHNTSRSQSVSQCKCLLEATTPTSDLSLMRMWKGQRNSHGSEASVLHQSNQGKVNNKEDQ